MATKKGYTCPKTGGWFNSKKEHDTNKEYCGCAALAYDFVE